MQIEIPEVFSKPVKIGGVIMYTYKHPKEGQRYISVKDYNKRYKKTLRGESNKIKVYQYTLDFVLIAEHESITEAAATVGISRHCISYCLFGSQRTSAGFIWSIEPLKIIRKKHEWDYSNKNFSF